MPRLGGTPLTQTLLFMCFISGFLSNQDCDKVFDSNQVSWRDTFSSPNWPDNYPTGKRCEYKFIAKLNQRVKLQFTSFNIQGLMPSCQFDYLDIYAQIRGVMNNLLEAPLLGRFCGEGLEYFPDLIISTHNIIILVFYSDSSRPDKGFQGTYEFIDASIYNIGHPVDTNKCGYRINASKSRMGYIISPTYPGVYPDNLGCFYRLVGRTGERIQLKFVDFSLFHGGEYCPFDYVAVYDGENNKSPVIGVFCGTYQNVTLYSTTENLYIEFVTRSGRVDFDRTSLYESADFTFNRRGFNITYEFNSNLVKLDFVEDAGTEHVRGTECDVRIKSSQESSGRLLSPGYDRKQLYPINKICTYYLDGLMNKQNVEKVIVEFKDFNITESQNCNSGTLTVNYHGYRKVGTVDERYCGALFPPRLISKDARMVLTLNTMGASPGKGFNATYKFLRDFGIPGQHVGPDARCAFLYERSQMTSGKFNSPMHPDSYPENNECHYIFSPADTEKILISFDVFSLAENSPNCVNTDYIEIFEKTSQNNFTSVSRYCGKWLPGPFLSSKETKLVFHSGSGQAVIGTGFRARYEFLLDGKLKTDCGPRLINSGSGENGGVIKSPNFPDKYSSYTYCEWLIKASKTENRILLQFETFITGGKRSPFATYSDTEVEGCPHAVMRIYFDVNGPPTEICGSLDEEVINSTRDRIKISFLTASQALNMKGFNIAWTERHEGANCYGFKCKKTGFCISSELKCNNLPNCGKGDNSDEVEACGSAGSRSWTCSSPFILQTLALILHSFLLL